jgi:hypothetical protein
MSLLINRLAIITSDNDNYAKYRGATLRITHVAYNKSQHPGYDSCMAGEALCDFVVDATNREVPFSLYEYEFKCID